MQLNDVITRLRRANYAGWDSGRLEHPTTCLEGTRQEVLEQIESWRTDEDPQSPRIFFLHGIAGIGKSTIAQTVAVAADRDDTLAASFFFSRRGDSDLRDPMLLLPTLAYQLARSRAPFAQALCGALDGHEDVCHQNYEKQLQALFLSPLQRIPSTGRPIFMVVDAVDEAAEAGMRLLLPTFLRAVCATPARVKLFITGRPESHIRSALRQQLSHRQIILHDIESSLVHRDIGAYLKTELTKLPEKLDLARSLPQDWFSPSELQQLVDRSGTLFVFASTLLRFVGDVGMGSPRSRLNMLLKPETLLQDGALPYADLDQLYADIISSRNTPSRNSRQATLNFRAVVGTLITLQDTLPLEEVARLLGFPLDEVHSILNQLGSVIILPQSDKESAHIYHQSFSDFLTDEQRCPANYHVDTKDCHERLAQACLSAIIQHAVAQPSGQSSAGTLSLPSHLKYAVLHWASHLSQSEPGHTALCSLLERFACTSLIQWMILASAIGQASTLALSSQQAEHWVVSSMNKLTLWMENDTWPIDQVKACGGDPGTAT
jgi:hypothetical protein